MHYITRSIEEKLNNLIKKSLESNSPSNVIILEGARQTGKSTLIEHILKDYQEVIRINLEKNKILKNSINKTQDFNDFKSLLINETNFDPQKKQILFIDEAQESYKIGSYVRFMKEDWINTCSILTGSSMKRLFSKDQRIPVGRTTRILLTPFTFEEFLKAKSKFALLDIINNFELRKDVTPLMHNSFLIELSEYIKVGGLPDVINSYIAGDDYLFVRQNILYEQEEDFIRIENEIPKIFFQEALKAIANNLGYPSKYSQVGSNYYFAKKIFENLEFWKLAYTVEQKTIQTTNNPAPKRYIYDIGIASDLRNMPFPEISVLNTLESNLRRPLGGLFENIVLLQIMAENISQGMLSGWKDKNNKEVDFIIRREKIIPIECKSSMKLTTRAYHNLLSYLDLANLNRGFVVSLAPYSEIVINEKTLINLPLYLFNLKNIESAMF